MPTARQTAESQGRKAKLANSYHELLEEFSSKDLRNVGNYSLGRLIGKGSFGKVYLATHKLTNGSKVVLKSAKKEDSNLAREIHHHRQFLHPHIARLYEVIVTESLVWLVLEYCPGDELYNYLLKHGPLPVTKVQRVFTQLVGAVTYVHNSSCVHRDLKLENILLDKNENVKLCDFGFTREYEGKASYLQTFCGTVCYSAPEMLKGEKYAGEKVDVWSLGVILYALLCGELPFDEDDDTETRTKILASEPKWPEHLTPDSRSLLTVLLSKRPLLRPTLPDILTHPFLAEHAPQQQAILKLEQPAPFTTTLEKETLERMCSAGVDIDQVIENVLARRCDALAGWWSLLIEKEERKQARRERKRKEKEAEARAARRLSGASSRLDRTSILQGVNEEGYDTLISGEALKSRGRSNKRSAHYPELVLSDLPGLPEHDQLKSPGVNSPPPPIEKDPIRSASSSRHRKPIPPPKEGVLRSARSRGSTLQLVTTNPDLLSPPVNGLPHHASPRKHQHPFINQLSQWRHWIIDNAKRAKSPGKRATRSTPDLTKTGGSTNSIGTKGSSPQPATSKTPTSSKPTFQLDTQNRPLPAARMYSTPTNNKRLSISPSPLTPRSTFRRPSGGLRGRKSTSSSVSSIRSIHHHRYSHSKASSTSSNGSEAVSKVSLPTRSPHHSVKVLPATPTASAFPSNIRVVRQAPISSFNEGLWGSNSQAFGASNGGLVFAKRKKQLFKGPMLNTTVSSPTVGSSGAGARTGSHSRSASVAGRRSGEVRPIEEEDEDEIEEVEAFSPIMGNETEETIYPTGETPK
ncbi:serine/threonine protein kinase-like protein [Calycina marina]|uniref:Serine/threonine protein kinase-like protein n=1 Tax=Calycina marina TaxID=1763456 RepID=A0A9P7Z7P3_9HELO|nr:serine/threonine protein kinase-like protein [Calycina marina]